jgi:hypothetical protein
MPKGVPQWQYDRDVRDLIIDERAWLRLAVSTLIDLSTFLMTAHDNETDVVQRILGGMAELLKEHGNTRDAQLAGIQQQVSHVSRQVEEMRRTHAGNLERLSDRMYERAQTGDNRYTEFSTRMQDAEARLTLIEGEIADLKAFIYDIAEHLPKPDEAVSGD